MKLKASTIRSELNKKIQENKLKIQEEQRLANERLEREKDKRAQEDAREVLVWLANDEKKARQRKINSKRAKDRKSLETEILKLALEGEFQMVAQFGEINWREQDGDESQNDDKVEELSHHYGIGVFSELSEYGFEIVPMTPKPMSQIQYFIQSADKTALSEAEDNLTYFWEKFIDVCERDGIARLLTLLTNYKELPDRSANVRSLALLIHTISTLIDRYYDDETSEPYFDVLCLLAELDDYFNKIAIDDLTSPADYEQYVLSWKKMWRSAIENDSLLNGRYFNWIAKKDGQRFFNLTEWAIAQCVKDLSSQLTLELTVEKSKTTVALITPNIAEDYDGNLAPPLNGILCSASPLSPQHLIRIFKHLGFKVSLTQTEGDNTESYTLELQW